jgi:predicted nucleic acid-binding protein
MAANPSRPPLVAVDANVLFDLAGEVEDVVDSVSLLRERLPESRFLLPPTVQQELANWALRGDTAEKRNTARRAVQVAQRWRIVPVSLIAVSHGIAERIARRLRELDLVPEDEVHDSFILAEAGLLNCSILLTSDEHLRGVDFQRLTFEFQSFDVAAPVIATPREIVRKFFR